MIKITICDDHKLVREGVKQIINSHQGMEVIDEYENGEELISEIGRNLPDILLLDISLPGRSGLETLKQMKINHPDLRVLVLSMYPEEQYAIRMFKSGASGYLHKDSSPEQMFEAINSIYNGRVYFSDKATQLLLQSLKEGPGKLHHQILSDREYDIMIQLGSGKSVNEIADMISISNKTVSTYKNRIMSKMNFKNNYELIQYVNRKELI